MNEIKDTVARLEELKAKAQRTRDEKVRYEAQLEIAHKERDRLREQLREQNLDEQSAQQMVTKIVTAVNLALDKVESFLERRT